MKPVVNFPIENEMRFESPILMHRVTLASVVLEGCYTQRHHLTSRPESLLSGDWHLVLQDTPIKRKLHKTNTHVA